MFTDRPEPVPGQIMRLNFSSRSDGAIEQCRGARASALSDHAALM
jgi:hypothetical protein